MDGALGFFGPNFVVSHPSTMKPWMDGAPRFFSPNIVENGCGTTEVVPFQNSICPRRSFMMGEQVEENS